MPQSLQLLAASLDLQHKLNLLQACSAVLGQQASVQTPRDLEPITQQAVHPFSVPITPLTSPRSVSAIPSQLPLALALERLLLRLGLVEEVSLGTPNNKTQPTLSELNSSSRPQITYSAVALVRPNRIQELLLYSISRNLRLAFSVHLLLLALVVYSGLHNLPQTQMPLEQPTTHKTQGACSVAQSQLQLVLDFSASPTIRQMLAEAASSADLVHKTKIKTSRRPLLFLVG